MSFVSTSTSIKVANKFLTVPPFNHKYVLFEINIDLPLHKIIAVNMAYCSHYYSEDEILLMPGLIYEIKQT
jgi:hypothetical protein